ncbi:hypothetical protein HK103_000820 [Boothiomyces macroporosus]|uniref:Autophagy-related protein 13 n=1 Tax=Boothiomyces macroporosus TaxID=261099 RepID=A0AAD5UC00_9FUNG|nr:hypothetical protein HK103_000820 [Boothiomyces macroporosus]
MHITNREKLELLISKEFISKIGETVLRQRIHSKISLKQERNRTKSESIGVLFDSKHSRTKSDPLSRKPIGFNQLELYSLGLDRDFWANAVPIHLDILSDKGVLLERWILSFHSNISFDSIKQMEYTINRKNSRENLQEESLNDYSDLILLSQSLYSKIRTLPLGNALIEGKIDRSSLRYSLSFANGNTLIHTSSCSESENKISSDGFCAKAQLDVFKFRSGSGPIGNLSVTVVYDSNLETIPKQKVPVEWSPNGDMVSEPPFELLNSDGELKKEMKKTCPTSPYPTPTTHKKAMGYFNKLLKSDCKQKQSRLSSSFKQEENDCEDPTPFTLDSSEPIPKRDILVRKPETMKQSIIIKQSRRVSITEMNGSFIGSYEESILIGRLSTSPSKPIQFVADIGVLAMGKCKPSLKCPPHAVINFPAFFYDIQDNFATPYVGNIELKDSAGYRLPLKGQLQIMIKNPNCTAIKVFLIPYDFKDMPACSKTFIRQKSYAISKSAQVSPDRLRFAIHLNFQMTLKSRLYLHSNIRVVFSPRPIETDESLKIVYQGPQQPKRRF